MSESHGSVSTGKPFFSKSNNFVTLTSDGCITLVTREISSLTFYVNYIEPKSAEKGIEPSLVTREMRVDVRMPTSEAFLMAQAIFLAKDEFVKNPLQKFVYAPLWSENEKTKEKIVRFLEATKHKAPLIVSEPDVNGNIKMTISDMQGTCAELNLSYDLFTQVVQSLQNIKGQIEGKIREKQGTVQR